MLRRVLVSSSTSALTESSAFRVRIWRPDAVAVAALAKPGAAACSVHVTLAVTHRAVQPSGAEPAPLAKRSWPVAIRADRSGRSPRHGPGGTRRRDHHTRR